MISKINNLEDQYKKNEYNGSSNLYKIRGFKSNVMLSAPHSVNQIRKGNIKYAEVYTGSMTEYLSENLSVCSIIKTLNDNDDANFDDNSKYRNEAVKLVERNEIKFLIDIHGASESRDFDIEIGTARGKNINYNDDIVEICLKLAKEYGFLNVNVDDLFTASNKNTVSRYVNEKTGIYAIQLEINKKYRSPHTNYKDFENMLQFISHLITTISNYIEKQFIDVISVSGRGLNPLNKIELPVEYIEKYGLRVNEEVHLVNLSGESIVCNVKNSSDNKICVSLRYFNEYFKLSGKASIFMSQYQKASILKPRIELIDNHKMYVTKDIYDIIQNKQIELINITRNRKIVMNVEAYPYSNNYKQSIWLNYYQRKLLGVELPDKLSPEEFSELNNHFKSKRNIDLAEGYYEKDNLIYQISPSINQEKVEELSTYYRKDYCIVKWKMSSRNSDKNFNIYDKIVGKQEIHLIAGRGDEKDDGSELVRMSANTIKLLGIDETDNVRIKYNGSEIIIRALSFDNIDMEKIMRANNIKSCEDVEYLIGIPAKYRLQLGIYEIGSSVKVERDTKYLFIKNFNTQLLSVFGTIITITQLPFENIWIKGILAVISIPVVMNAVLSYERAKVSN